MEVCLKSVFSMATAAMAAIQVCHPGGVSPSLECLLLRSLAQEWKPWGSNLM